MERRYRSPIQPNLPTPETRAYFPEPKSMDEHLKDDVLKRTGDNLTYAIKYGSAVMDDASPTSMVDMILVVDDTKKFHKRNIEIAPNDYGLPQLPDWHNYLNNSGFNFYYGNFETEKGLVRAKYAVISTDNFIKGCHGTLQEKESKGEGDFGLYVAGRMQKAALKPFFKTEKEEKVMKIEKAINSARIDGVWLALGLVSQQFSFNELLEKYVSLSYMADLRVEKPRKIQIMIEKNYTDYCTMLQPILEGFAKTNLISKTDEGKWEKLSFPGKNEVKKRLDIIKIRTTITNYLKNPMTAGLSEGIVYAWHKVERSLQSPK